LLFFAAAFQAFGLFAQNDGDIRSAASGSWGDNTTWEQYDADAGSWVAAAAVPPSSSVITIRNGHTISLDGTKTAFILNIENGGVLKSDGTGVKNMRIANTLNNNGSFGASGSNERVNIEPYL